MKTFIVLFVLALLFVIGSAGAMRYFDRKRLPPAKKDARKKNESANER